MYNKLLFILKLTLHRLIGLFSTNYLATVVHFACNVWLQLFVETMFRILIRVFPKIETWVIFVFVCLIVFLKSKISVFRHIFRTSQHCILKTWINFETIKCTDIFYLLINDNLGNVKN